MKNLVFIFVLFVSQSAFARVAGNEGGGGGDLQCDAKIQSLVSDLQSWIKNRGPESGVRLDLSSSLNPETKRPYTLSEYSSTMLELLKKRVDANCVSPSDSAYPVEVGSSSKICKTYGAENSLHMVCDRKLFQNLTADEQIQQIHHEIAIHVPGLEPVEGSLSTYKISLQLAAFTEDVPSRRLVVMDLTGQDQKEVKFAHEQIKKLEWQENTSVMGALSVISSFLSRGWAVSLEGAIRKKDLVEVVLGDRLLNQAREFDSAVCADGLAPKRIEAFSEKLNATLLKNADGSWKLNDDGHSIKIAHSKVVTFKVECSNGRIEDKQLDLSDSKVMHWVRALEKRAYAIINFREPITEGKKEKEMKKVILAPIVAAMVVTSAHARPAPDSGASGDMRRNLTTALYEMGAVFIPNHINGAYKGLYNVDCYFLEGNWRMCYAATSPSGTPVTHVSSAAMVMGHVFVSNIKGALGARRIRADLVACNTVGDSCTISGITLE